jgi:hypothetical protein
LEAHLELLTAFSPQVCFEPYGGAIIVRGMGYDVDHRRVAHARSLGPHLLRGVPVHDDAVRAVYIPCSPALSFIQLLPLGIAFVCYKCKTNKQPRLLSIQLNATVARHTQSPATTH